MDTIDRIKQLRKAKKLSQNFIATGLNFKTAAAYGKIENNDVALTVDKFIEICKILEVDSYDNILPPLPKSHDDMVEDLLYGGLSAFNLIRTQGNYVRGQINELIEKLKVQGSFNTDSIIKDLELYDDFLKTIVSESFKYSDKFSTRLQVILHPPRENQ
jgi:transcriptional regulator with XRE-family HTH domain